MGIIEILGFLLLIVLVLVLWVGAIVLALRAGAAYMDGEIDERDNERRNDHYEGSFRRFYLMGRLREARRRRIRQERLDARRQQEEGEL